MNPYDEEAEEEPIEAYDDDRMEFVTFCTDQSQAEDMQALLADHGIEVEIDEEGLFGEEADGVAIVAAASDVEDARVVLDRLDMIEEIAEVESDDEVDDFDDDDDDEYDDDDLMDLDGDDEDDYADDDEGDDEDENYY